MLLIGNPFLCSVEQTATSGVANISTRTRLYVLSHKKHATSNSCAPQQESIVVNDQATTSAFHKVV